MAKKLQEQLRQASAKLGNFVRRDKELNFQQKRLDTDIEKLEATKLQRDVQVTGLTDRIEYLQTEIASQSVILKSKTGQVKKVGDELQEVQEA